MPVEGEREGNEIKHGYEIGRGDAAVKTKRIFIGEEHDLLGDLAAA